jgi:predicted nucleic acid-binding Zn ribbon protein
MASLSVPSHHCVALCGSLPVKLLQTQCWNPVQILNLLGGGEKNLIIFDVLMAMLMQIMIWVVVPYSNLTAC